MTYTAVVLTDESRELLIDKFRFLIPEDFEIIAHHMTMYMGPARPEDKERLGEFTTMAVLSYAMDDKVIAVGVSPWHVETDNKIPHITIAVNRKAGGKPVMSNKLKDWKPVFSTFRIRGRIEEVI